ncbi:MAG: hypothetical protein AVDCRST_MAG75-3010 [uncultured Propionibacteriaceae bacterium]|uniref:ANTAR domain-containing protein n=1 Tax=uncultured Propionibacteriaceae bacterium TaxID=257457 RepID=A0A6J4PJG7_9ACTN|nr:MAG: hypothetical protein AVDCRST_MAG75-3010 [uncultured Propionibacteriaceae bacterium]
MVTSDSPPPAVVRDGLLLVSDLAGSRQRLQPVLDLATVIAAESIPTAAGAGISLIDENGTKTSTASTHPLVAVADDRQYELGEGPCLTSWAENAVVRIDDLDADGRWPRWADAARALHLRSVLSAPVVTPHRTAGALKVYSDQPYAFDRAVEHLLLRFAEQSGILVGALQSLQSAEVYSETIKAGLRSRQLIAAAQGVLVERHQLTPEQAFLRLTEDARRNGHTVADEAATLLPGW